VLCAGSTLLLAEDALTCLIVNGALVGVSLGYQASPSVVWLPPLLIDIPWFLTEGKPCCYINHTFLLGFPAGRCFTLSTLCRIKLFSGAVAGAKKEDFCKGSFARTSFTLFYVLLYFIFTCIVLSKTQKN
jgi:hypothetical protein